MVTQAHNHICTLRLPRASIALWKYGLVCVGSIPAVAWAHGGYEVLFYLLFAAPIAVVGAVLLLIELFKKTLTYRSVWGGLLLFPLYAIILEAQGYPMRPAFLNFEAKRSREIAQQNATPPSYAEPEQPAERPAPRFTGSNEGLVSSYGNTKVAADAPLVYNAQQDSFSTQCKPDTGLMQIELLTTHAAAANLKISVRLNNEQDERPLAKSGRATLGEQTLTTFQTKIACNTLEMLFVNINTEPTTTVLIYHVKQ